MLHILSPTACLSNTIIFLFKLIFLHYFIVAEQIKYVIVIITLASIKSPSADQTIQMSWFCFPAVETSKTNANSDLNM